MTARWPIRKWNPMTEMHNVRTGNKSASGTGIRITWGGGGLATEGRGKVCAYRFPTVGPGCQAGSQKQLAVLRPCMLAKVALVW